MKEPEMEQIADFISRAVKNYENEEELSGIKKEVNGLCAKFPLYPELSM